jgi:nucleoside-diphosphate-sugar epimerase
MIAVFGATGFIGSKFCEKFRSEVFEMERNIVIPEKSCDKILYLISTVDNYNVLTDPYVDINTNLTHLIKVLENCKDRDVEFTFISSWFVYGETELPAKETSPCNPKGFYSITKLAAEQLLESYCKTFNIKYKIIRLGNVVGKGDGKVSKKKNALQFLINEMREGRNINLYDSGEFYRDIVHVDDVVSGIKYIMDHCYHSETYNLGSAAKPVLFKDVIAYLHHELNSDSVVGTMDQKEFHKIVQVKSMYLDCSKLTDNGWKPSRTVFQAIHELI